MADSVLHQAEAVAAARWAATEPITSPAAALPPSLPASPQPATVDHVAVETAAGKQAQPDSTTTGARPAHHARSRVQPLLLVLTGTAATLLTILILVSLGLVIALGLTATDPLLAPKSALLITLLAWVSAGALGALGLLVSLFWLTHCLADR